MLVFFLKSAKLDPKGFNLVFYTGKEPLPDTIENYNGNVNLTIIRERPNLANVIPNIIQDIDKYGHSQAEAELPDKHMVALAMLQEENQGLLQSNDDGTKLTMEERAAKLAAYAENKLGYNLTELINELPNHPTLDAGNTNSVEETVTATKALLERIDQVNLDASKILEDFDPTHHVSPDEYIHNGHSVWTTSESSHRIFGGVLTGHRNHEHQPLLEEEEEAESGFEEKLVPPSSSAPFAGSVGSPSNRAISRRGVTRYATRLADQLENVAQYDEEQATAGVGNSVISTGRIWEENKSARPYVHSMPDTKLETWAFFYCGGRNPLLEALVKESKDLSIPLHEEAFDW